MSRSLAALAFLALPACMPLPQMATGAPPPPSAATPAEDPGLVSAADPRAAAAGAQMLRQGGSATDAAIATMLALNVVEPQSSGIGGGGFLLTADGSGTVESIDGREAAPAAAGPRWFYRDGEVLSHQDAVPGGRSVGVPGNLRLAALAHTRHGRIAWGLLFQPAIRLAREGFAVSPRLRSTLALFRQAAAFDPAGRALFFGPDGEPVPVGTIVRNPALADALERIAARGADAFYTGPQAEAIAAKVGTAPRNPAPMATSDLARYMAKDRPPLCARYRVYRVCSMGPPSAGGIIVLQSLGMLERFDLARMGPSSPVAWHLLADAERLAFADRDRFIADPDQVRVPVAGLLAPDYIARRSALLSETAALSAAPSGDPAGADPALAAAAPVAEHGTTHFVAVDRWGGVASYTSTIEGGFGSGLVVDGFYLNNELTDFNLEPEVDGKPTANAVAGGKRPRSSMSPVIVFGPDGHVRLVAGAAGGATIPAQVLRVVIGTLDWKLSAREAIALGVVMPFGDVLAVEKGSALEAMIPALVALGHAQTAAVPMRLKANAAEWTGHWTGAADPRSEGALASP